MKQIRLSESQLVNLIKKIIKENTESENKISILKSQAGTTLKNNPCWSQGLCPKVESGSVIEGECEFCPGPLAGIIIPAIGGIVLGVKMALNRRDDKKRQQEQLWIKQFPDLKNREFIYFKDGSVQAVKTTDKNDVMIKSKEGNWVKLDI
jgi:hypothetical protein